MLHPQAVLFDHDGVLVASEPLHWAAWGRLLKELGLSYAPQELQELAGRTAPQILARFLDRHRPGWSEADYDLNALALRKNDFYLERARTELAPYPGVVEGLRELRARGIRTAVVSNAKRRELDQSLVGLGLGQWIEVSLSRDDVSPPKPDPAPYLTAAGMLGVSPAGCLAVEDAPPGLEAALRAGIPTVAVKTHFTREILSAPVPGRPDLRPIAVVESMVEFFSRLRNGDLPATVSATGSK